MYSEREINWRQGADYEWDRKTQCNWNRDRSDISKLLCEGKKEKKIWRKYAGKNAGGKNQEKKGFISDHIVVLLSVPAKRVATFYITWLHLHYAVMVRHSVDIYIHILLKKETHNALFKEYLIFVYMSNMWV